jgi:hypothetical protein
VVHLSFTNLIVPASKFFSIAILAKFHSVISFRLLLFLADRKQESLLINNLVSHFEVLPYCNSDELVLHFQVWFVILSNIDVCDPTQHHQCPKFSDYIMHKLDLHHIALF